MKPKCGCHPFTSWEKLIVPFYYQFSTQYLAFKPSLSFMQFLVIFLNCTWSRSLVSLLPSQACLYLSLYRGTHTKWYVSWCKWMRLLVQRDVPGWELFWHPQPPQSWIVHGMWNRNRFRVISRQGCSTWSKEIQSQNILICHIKLFQDLDFDFSSNLISSCIPFLIFPLLSPIHDFIPYPPIITYI